MKHMYNKEKKKDACAKKDKKAMKSQWHWKSELSKNQNCSARGLTVRQTQKALPN